MNRAEFREQVKAYTEFEGSSHVTDDADFDKWIDRGIDLFSVLTACIYTSFAAFTPSVGSRTYDLLDDTVCTPRVWLATNVVVAGSPLTALDGKPGPCTPQEMLEAGMHAAGQGKPRRWSREGAHSIVFDLSFSQAFSPCYVTGYAMPDHLTDEGEQVGVPLEYHPIAAMFCAGVILDPRAAGGQLARVERIDKKAGEYMSVLMEQGKMAVRSVLGGIPIESSQEEAL